MIQYNITRKRAQTKPTKRPGPARAGKVIMTYCITCIADDGYACMTCKWDGDESADLEAAPIAHSIDGASGVLHLQVLLLPTAVDYDKNRRCFARGVFYGPLSNCVGFFFCPVGLI